MAQIFVTGSTGLIGRAVVAHLQAQGHSINTWVRNTARATSLLGEGIRILGPDLAPEDLVYEMENADAVINLAGRSLASSRWTEKNKETFISSRVGLTRLLANSMKQCANPPKVFISSSAVGYYGDRGSEPLNEASGIGDGFLSKLCADWEQAALETTQIGTRVCLLRTGIVLGREGGILKQIMQGFDVGIGLYTGTDEQTMSWIHLTDMARVIRYCLENPSMSGPVNCASPSATTAKSFARTLGTITHSRILIRIPSLVLRIVLGDGAKALSQSQNVVPAKLNAAGFEFQYDDLETALRTECRPDQVVISKRRVDTNPPKDVHKQPCDRAQFELTSSIAVKSDQATTFAFFSSPHNLGLLTPSWMNFRISEIPGSITEGSEIAYRLKIGLLPIKWRSKIVRWNPNEDFIDSQVKGPYKVWWHEHRITRGNDGGSVMSDTVRYSLPGGVIGKLIHNLFIRRTLIRIFNYRRQVIALRFG